MAMALTGAVLLGIVLARLERRRPDLRGRLVRNLAWFGALAITFVVSIALTVLVYWVLHPDRQPCTSLVWRWFFLPPVVLFVTGVVWGIREQRRQGRVPAGQRV
jgi:MFS family permease